MEATNYLRTAIDLSKRGSNPTPGPYWVTAQRAQVAPKFSLPFGGRLFDHDLSEMPTPVRLPFPMVVLEFPTHEYPLRPLFMELPDDKRGDVLEQDSGRDRLIVIATQNGEEPITLTIVQRGISTDTWTWAPFTVAIAYKREVTPDNPAGLWMKVNKRYPLHNEKPLSAKWMGKVAEAVMTAALFAVYDMVFALDTNRVSVTTVEARKLNKAAKKRGALPFDTYKVLTILPQGEDKSETKTPSGDPIDRRISREHERRGHWRRYKSGKEVFIETLTVNKGVGGKIIKDYELKV
jgi:hypothetical protein